MRIGIDRVGKARVGGQKARPGYCPTDGARGIFRLTALVCPRCGRLLGGC